MSKVIIAEKPSVAKSIASVVGATTSRGGFIEGNGYQVTWALGHLVTIYAKEQECPRDREHLPVLPPKFELRVIEDVDKNGKKVESPTAKKQLEVIRSLFKSCDEIIVATDAGREGELIFRYIYEYLNCSKPFLRLWASSMTARGIKEAMNNLLPGHSKDNMAKAARQRAEADWLVGINASRALTVHCKNIRMLSLGRVQTPTLVLICRRWDENRFFVPEPFWTINALTSKNGIVFKSACKTKFANANDAKAAQENVEKRGYLRVDKVVKQRKEETAPLLYNLTELQKAGNTKYGYSADLVLQTAQSLYMKGMLSYPRSDAEYITKADFERIPTLLKVIENHPKFGQYAKGMNRAELNQKCVDEKKVTDHCALMIEETKPEGLSDIEQKIYDLVVVRMLEAFSPSCFADVTKVELSSGDYPFAVSGRVIITPGWRAVTKQFEEKLEKDEAENDDAEQECELPKLMEGEQIKIAKVDVLQSETRPKPILTESSLLTLMKNAGRETDDAQAKEGLKLSSGIGTSATRAATIETLLKRGFIYRDGKKLYPTELGYAVYQYVKSMKIADVALTGLWENELFKIEEGRRDDQEFAGHIRTFTKNIVNELFEGNNEALLGFCDSGGSSAQGRKRTVITCPKCGKAMKSWPENVSCEKECGYRVWRTIGGKKLTDVQMKALIETGAVGPINGFTGKNSGKVFSAKLKLSADGTRPEYDFDNNAESNGGAQTEKVALICPRCGKPLTDWPKSVSCTQECGFVVWKTIGGKRLTAGQVRSLVEKGCTDMIEGFVSKSGKNFSAKLKYNEETGRVEYDFNK